MREIVRVVKPGGWIVMADPDFISSSTDTPEVDIERRLIRLKADSMGNGYAARQLYRLFKEAELVDVSVTACPCYITDQATARYLLRSDELEQLALEAGVISQPELTRYRAVGRERDEAGLFFAYFNMLQVISSMSLQTR